MSLKQKLFAAYFMMLPFIDLITSLMTRYNFPITIGTIIRGLTFIFGVFYVFFISKNKYKKKAVIYYLSVIVFSLLYFITKIDILSISGLLYEINIAVKYLYFPIMLVAFYILFDDLKIDNQIIKRIIITNCFSYTILMLIPYFTGTSFDSYRVFDYEMHGSNGWFFAANETGAILVLLAMSMYYLMDINKKSKILLCLPIMFSITIVGTKVSFIGLICVTFILMLAIIINNKKNRYFLPICLLVMLIFCSLISPTVSNVYSLNNAFNSSEKVNENEVIENGNENDEVINNDINEVIENDNNENDDINKEIENSNLQKILNVLFSGRTNYFVNNYKIYKESGIVNILFGMGWQKRPEINYTPDKILIEIDFLDVFIHYGIFGFIIYFLPLTYLVIQFIKRIKMIDVEISIYVFMLLIIFGISTMAGHTLGAPSVSVYIILFLIYIINKLKGKQKGNKYL